MTITMRDMIKAGAHFGHRTRYWNPKMAPYIFGDRHNIHIINLEKTMPLYQDAVNFLGSIVNKKGKVLFVGTKRAAQKAIAEAATACGMPYVNHRWLGGMLTNYKTVRQSIKKLRDLEQMEEDGSLDRMIKKEALQLRRNKAKLAQSFDGIKNMGCLPDALFVIDSNHEDIAITEAKRLGIPVVSVVDTNCDPNCADYIIPGNDDATRAIQVYLRGIVEAVNDAKQTANVSDDMEKVAKGKQDKVDKQTITVKKKSGEEVTEETVEKAESKKAAKPKAAKPKAAAKPKPKAKAAEKVESTTEAKEDK